MSKYNRTRISVSGGKHENYYKLSDLSEKDKKKATAHKNYEQMSCQLQTDSGLEMYVRASIVD
jgi:hypothetical protein